jgi:hypothetical protein
MEEKEFKKLFEEDQPGEISIEIPVEKLKPKEKLPDLDQKDFGGGDN